MLRDHSRSDAWRTSPIEEAWDRSIDTDTRWIDDGAFASDHPTFAVWHCNDTSTRISWLQITVCLRTSVLHSRCSSYRVPGWQPLALLQVSGTMAP